MHDSRSSLEARSAERRKRMVTHRANGFADAEQWDLAFWQQRSPHERLAAAMAIRDDVRKAQQAAANRKDA